MNDEQIETFCTRTSELFGKMLLICKMDKSSEQEIIGACALTLSTVLKIDDTNMRILCETIQQAEKLVDKMNNFTL